MTYHMPYFIDPIDDYDYFSLFINEEHIDGDYDIENVLSWVADVKLTGEALDGDIIAIVTGAGIILYSELV